MIIFRQQLKFFLGLKCIQTILATSILAFELCQYIYYGEKFVPVDARNDWFDPAYDDQESNGQTKIWVITVCALTIVSHVMYIIRFIKIWNQGPYVLIEILFFALWLTSSLSNLDPLYRGLDNLNCRSPVYTGYTDGRVICALWVTSIIFGWITLATYLLSVFFAWQASKELRSDIGNRILRCNNIIVNNKVSTPETLHEQKKMIVQSNINTTPITVITVPTNAHLHESEKEIPQQTQLLLQSGLPDQGIPLQIVFPQNGFQRVSEGHIAENNERHEEPQLPQIIQPQDATTSPPEQDRQQPQQENGGNANLLNVIQLRKPSTSSLHEVPL